MNKMYQVMVMVGLQLDAYIAVLTNILMILILIFLFFIDIKVIAMAKLIITV